MTIRIIALVFVLILVYAAYTISRSSILLSHSQSLYKASAGFKTDYYVGKSSDAVQLMIVLGDSTAVGTGASALEDSLAYKTASAVSAKGAYVHVINLAKSGAKITDVVSSQLPHLTNLKPSVILVSVGANDATHFTGLDQYQKSLQEFFTTLINSGASTILFATSPDMHTNPALPSWFSHFVGYRSERERTLLQQAVAGSRVQVIDLYRDGKLKDHDLYASDLFHPSSKGYGVWSKLFIDSLTK